MNHSRELWRSARTLEDLGELTAQWLEGRITHLPAYYSDAPAPETSELIPHLTRANRAGYLTTDSQPGRPLTDGCGQRAYVSGFCTEETADKIEAAILGTDLVAIITPPGWGNPTQIPVTVVDAKDCAWLGTPLDAADIDDFYGGDCPNAVNTLKHAWQVELFDPAWGRANLLWERLAQAWE